MSHSLLLPKIAIVTALACEARPIIDLCKLKKIDRKVPFPIYSNENISLIVSNPGKINSALAVAVLQSFFSVAPAAWLNIGIAGQRDAAVGSIFMAHKIIDKAIMKSYYPNFLQDPPLSSSIICTVDQPEFLFEDSYIYEMEASGFMQAALRFATIERIHCCKIISDNLKTRFCFNSRFAQKLIESRMFEISQLIEYLKQFKNSIKVTSPLKQEDFTEHWHFTNTQKHHLERLLNRIACLNINTISRENFSHFCKAKEVLIEMENKINLHPLIF